MKEMKTICTFIFVLLLGCLCCQGQMTGSISPFSSKDVNYYDLYNKYVKAERDESLNAAPYYKKAFDLFVNLLPDINAYDLQAWPSKLPQNKLNSIKQWISANNQALEQFKLASQKEAYWLALNVKRLRDYQFTDLWKYRALSSALIFRAELNAINKDFNSCFSDLFSVYQVANHLSDKNLLIEQLVAIALRTLPVRTTFEILSYSALDSSLLKQLQEKFAALSGKTGKIDFYPERLFTYDYLKNLFTDDGKGDGLLSEKTIAQQIPALAGNVVQKKKQLSALKRNSTLSLADKQLDFLEQIKDKTPFQWKQTNARKNFTEITKDNVLLAETVNPTLAVIEMYFQSKMTTDALITTIALLRYKADKRDLPQTLEKLVSDGYLDKLPMDVCSDKPLLYKKTGDNFVLYSLGGDFDDDNAKIRQQTITDANGDIVFWPF